MKKKIKKSDIINYVFAGIFALLTLALIVQLFIFDKLPTLYFVIVCLVLILIAAGLIALQLSKKVNKKNKTLGKIVIVLLALLLGVGNVYVYKTNQTLSEITKTPDDKIEISVIVMKESPLTAIDQLKNKTVGRIEVGEANLINDTFEKIRNEAGHVSQLSYTSFIDFADALYNGEVDAIVLNEGFRAMFEDNHPDFDERTRVITSYSYDKKSSNTKVDVEDITKDTFSIYITGIDQRGTVGTLGRSDVNKIMTINPKTHEILLIDIPRDYYVPQVCQANQLDKLTHTGIFGPDCTVESVSNFFGVDINYYVRINFTSLEKIVDALGGVDVVSTYTFSAGGYQFYADQVNHLNGAAALAFSRERYSLPNGDGDRIRNQSLVLSGIIDKLTSPSIVSNYLGFMSSISGTFQTNMSEDNINDLIKMQINDMSGWNISSYAVSGTGGTDWTPANGFNAYVNYPNMKTVEKAVQKINQIKNGEILSAQE